ncbi:hypothetical protein CDZ98_01815 [Mameliella alba]|nr:hypothetical protein CDZ98_01815 [Mameliella alba]
MPCGSLFDFNGSSIRIIEIDGQPWFVAGDVLRVFNYSRPDNMLRSLDARDKMATPQSLRGMGLHPRSKLISEAGLYQIIMRAQRVHPIARDFRKWVHGGCGCGARVLPMKARQSMQSGIDFKTLHQLLQGSPHAHLHTAPRHLPYHRHPLPPPPLAPSGGQHRTQWQPRRVGCELRARAVLRHPRSPCQGLTSCRC